MYVAIRVGLCTNTTLDWLQNYVHTGNISNYPGAQHETFMVTAGLLTLLYYFTS